MGLTAPNGQCRKTRLDEGTRRGGGHASAIFVANPPSSYPVIQQIREDAIHYIDTPLTYDAMTAPDLSYTLVRPLTQKYQKLQNIAVPFCLLLNRAISLLLVTRIQSGSGLATLLSTLPPSRFTVNMIMHSGRNYTPLVGRRLSNRRSLSVDTLGPEYDSSASEPSPVVNRDHIKVSPPVSLDTPMHPTGHQPVAGVFNAAEEVTGDATTSDATKSDDPTRAEAREDAGAEARPP
ncbi:hypothetical protein BS47DRAFT_1403042 [Hydnum rufescens UP504]|uniref:Uncharacterized protein n=1 Tax=Hydnum rufescens UP504 TaxID=1448309 RepID=A0A9P6ABN5_9AGAM|nr:hypothetical protein BS47DRAFT_1403042 [Hydnum rufescens UP504]